MEENTGTFSAEQVEEKLNAYKSSQEAWVQKLINEWKFKDKLIDATGKVAWSKEALISIYWEDELVWQAILDKYYWGQSLSDYKADIGHVDSPEVLTDNLITQKVNSITKQYWINDKREAFVWKIGLEWEELIAFNKELDERMQLKSFDIDKDLVKAYKYITGYSEEDMREINKTKKYAKTTWLSWKDGTSGKKLSNNWKDALDFWKQYG